MKKILVFLAVLCFLPACTITSKPPAEERRIDNVVRVLMHEPSYYTLFSNPMDGKGPLAEEHIRVDGEVKIFPDVPADKPMHAIVHVDYHADLGWDKRIDILEIHVHSAEDINGAGWNHGKFGGGETVVIK